MNFGPLVARKNKTHFANPPDVGLPPALAGTQLPL